MSKEIKVFIGPEGAGKTKHSKLLAEKEGLPRISIGDILRDLQENDPGELGDKCREMFSKHTYLDPATLLVIQEDHFRGRDDLRDGFILDGGLRTVEEAHGFPVVLRKSGLELGAKVLYLKIPNELSFQRLVSEGGRNRSDDTIEGVTERLRNFNDRLDERLAAIENYYQILHIDATGTLEETFERICEALLNHK